MAVDALRHIGTPAVPFLIDCLSEARMEQFKLAAQKWRSRQESAVFQVPHPPSPRYEALAGLDALGSAAVSALPALEKLLHENPPDPEALYVATRMGSESIPLLTRSLNNQNKLIRLEAGVCLDMMKSHSKVLYPQVPVGSAVPSFDRRICEFHLELLKAAAKVYEVEHPESVLPDQELNFLPSPVMRK